MNVLKVALVAAAIGTLLVGCSNTSSSSTETKAESYSYSFELNGCKTGKHSLSSQPELCAALQDDALNKGCALEMRKKFFSEKCQGSFGSSSSSISTRSDTPTIGMPTSTTPEDSSIEYEYTSTGCTTGKQKFKTLAEFCAGLLDEALNKSCAHSQRVEMHQELCF